MSLPSLDPSQLKAIGSFKIPGSNLSPAESAANAANAASLSSLPSAASITASLTPGPGGGMPDPAAALAPLAAAPVAIPGLADIQKMMTSFQSNIGLQLAVMQAGIQDKIKSAAQSGSPPPDPNALASSMSANMFAPITDFPSVITNAISSGLPAIAAEIAKGVLGNPQAAAANVGGNLSSGMASLSGQASSQTATIVGPMKANAMASMLAGPMGQLPAIQAIMGTMGVPIPSAFAVARNLNNTVPVPNVMPVAPYSDKQFASSPTMDGASTPKSADPSMQVSQILVDGVISDFHAICDVVYGYYGGQRTGTSEGNQTLYDNWVNSLMPDGGTVRNKTTALLKTKPDDKTWSDDENTLYATYTQMMDVVKNTSPYKNYLTDKDQKNAVKSFGYEVISAMSNHSSKYSLTSDCQHYLKTKGWF